MKKVFKKLVPISLALGFVQNLLSWHYIKDAAASEIAWLADANPGGNLYPSVDYSKIEKIVNKVSGK